MLHPQLSKGLRGETLAGVIVLAQSNENLGPGHATRHHGHSYRYAVKLCIEHGDLELGAQLTLSILNNRDQTARAGGAAINRAIGGGSQNPRKVTKRHASDIVSCWVREFVDEGCLVNGGVFMHDRISASENHRASQDN
jgi:hypothetical protein